MQPWVLSHRVQLHEELKKLAVSSEGLGTPAVLQTSSQVVDVDPSTATVKLADGTSISGDLVLGADGVSVRASHIYPVLAMSSDRLQSITRQIVVGPGVKPYGSGKSAFRFMIPCERIGKNPITKEFLDRQGYLTMWMGDDRRLIMYPCSNNTVMNFVGIHPSEISAAASKGDGKSCQRLCREPRWLIQDTGWGQGGSKELLLDVYKGFEQRVRSLLELVDSSELKVWTLLDMERIPSWHRERLVLLGDAAHPFLPREFLVMA
jgi:2-polyprenyl-6-methoxyphenol hydroxylase-like FAD-dependent oxidoreductase